MIKFLILNNSGDVIYHSTEPKNQQAISELSKIRYLPLLLTKDLLKASFHDRIQYLHTRNKTITFLEKHGLLYIAWTQRGTIPVNLVHQHLFIIDRLLRFHFGPQWHTRVENISATRGNIYQHRHRRHQQQQQRQQTIISLEQVSTCISKIILINTQKPLYCPDMLCSVEQVELHDDLRTRLSQTLRQCCDMAFSTTFSSNNNAPTTTRFSSFFATPPRNITWDHHHRRRTNSFHEGVTSSSTATTDGYSSLVWSDVFLFVKNKIVVRCSNSEMDELVEEDLPHEVLFYLCHMAAEYADQSDVKEDLTGKRHVLHTPTTSTTRSQNILEPSYSTDSVHKPVYATSSDSTPTPQASSSEATSSQKSFVTYIYDSSSISAPFKVKEKSASSVTVASSNCSTPSLSWSSPPPLVHNQLLSRLSRRSGEYHYNHHHTPSTSSSSKLHHHHNQWPFISQKHQEQQKEKENHYHNKEDEKRQKEIKRRKQKPRPHLQVEIDGPDEQEEGTDADIEEEYEYDHDRVAKVEIIKEGLPRNAKLYHSSSEHAEDEAANCLSSSLPLDTVPFQGSPTRRRSSNTSNNTTVTITKQPVLFQSSAPSSPAVRSRSQSNADRLSAKQSLRHMFSSFLQNNNNNDNSDDDSATTTLPDNEIKVMPRWIKIGHRLVLCFILLIHLGDGICATIICRRDSVDSHTTETIHDKTTYYSVARALRSSLQEQLQDFTTFLLTKEATHFTILSFITAYPGLLHFIHLKDGVMLAPRIVDLNEFNNNQGLLLEIGEKYHQWPSSSSDDDRDEFSSLPTWGWPSITKLHDLCEQMVRNNDQSHNRMYHTVQLDSSAGRGFQCIYQRDKYGDLLMGLYFSFIPKNVLMDMHQRLFMDVSQRLP